MKKTKLLYVRRYSSSIGSTDRGNLASKFCCKFGINGKKIQLALLYSIAKQKADIAHLEFLDFVIFFFERKPFFDAQLAAQKNVCSFEARLRLPEHKKLFASQNQTV